jgi:hypothetical protein
MKLDIVIEDVQDAEDELAKSLRTVADRHAVEHDLYYVCRSLADQCVEHLEQLAPFADRYGASRRTGSVTGTPSNLEIVRRQTSEHLGCTEEAGMLLLKDLRSVYLSAQATEIAWVVLVQAVKVGRNQELLDTASNCRKEVEACGKWLRARIKEATPQVLATASS